MRDIYLNSDQIMKQEQCKDLLRQAEHYRLIQAVSKLEAADVQEGARAQRKGVAGLARRLASLVPLSPAQI
jgi:hypothetical protein